MTVRSLRIAALFLSFALAGCSVSGTEPPASAPSDAAAPTPGYVRDLVPMEFDEYLRRHPETFLMDVRQALEWDDDLGHIETAVQIPLEDLESRLKDLPPDHARPIAIYDRLDVRSSAAARRLAQMGYREVVTLAGGLAAYRKAGY